MIYAYIRTSTDKQNNANQRFEIERFAAQNKLSINKWVEETISSKKNLEERKLGQLLKKIHSNDIIISTEISRLGRNLLQVMSILHHCMTVGCNVWTIKDSYRLGADLQSKVLAFAFGLAAEIERTMISERTKRCLERLRAEGKHIGRAKGSKNKNTKLKGKSDLIQKLLSQNVSKQKIAQELKISYSTLYRFLKQSPT